MPRSAARKAPAAKAETAESSREERVRLRAYELYLQREGQPGDELDDWLKAEEELTSTSDVEGAI